MIKKFLFNLIIFFVLPVVSVLSINAFTVKADAPVATPFCFKTVRSGGHEATLSVDPADPPLANSTVYAMDCLSASDGQHCTTGNAAVDAFLSYPAMPSGLNYGFDYFKSAAGKSIVQTADLATQPLMTNGAAKLLYRDSTPVTTMLWGDHSVDTDRQWLGLSVVMPTPTVDPALGMGALQQATIPQVDWTSALQKCVKLNWDPDGVVFDSQSLEPIANASVTLTLKRANGAFTLVTPNDAPGGSLTNPFLALQDGGFSFFVPDGTYELTPQLAGYKFPSTLTLNTNYSKAYSDIYPSLTGVEIVEKGGPQHRDIPVDSATGQPTHFPIKFMSYSYQSDKVSSVFIDGRVSHPLATINAYSVVPDPSNSAATVRYRLVTTVQADKLGRFSLVVNQASFDSTKSEMFGEVEATKADFGASANDSFSAPALLKLNPILTYIQGQATSNGKALPGASVSLVYDGGTQPVYTTTADNQGNFTVPTDYIPTMPYKIRYTSGGATISLTTTNFVAANSANTSSNKINLFYPQYKDPTVNNAIKKSIAAYNTQIKNKQNGLASGSNSQGGTTAFGSQSGGSSGAGGNGSNGQGGSNGTGSTSSQTMSASKTMTFVGIIVFIIIVLAGVGMAGVYFIKKSQNVQNPPTV